MLVTLNLDERGDKLYWVEFKEIAPTSSVYSYNSYDVGAVRIIDNLSLTYGPDYSLVGPVAEIGDKPYYQRLRWDNFPGLEFDKINDRKEALAAISDQLYVVGQLHRQSFLSEGRQVEIQEYSDVVTAISTEDWLYDSSLLAAAMELSHHKLASEDLTVRGTKDLLGYRHSHHCQNSRKVFSENKSS